MDNKAEHAIVKGTLSMKVAAAVNSGGPAQGTWAGSTQSLFVLGIRGGNCPTNGTTTARPGGTIWFSKLRI